MKIGVFGSSSVSPQSEAWTHAYIFGRLAGKRNYEIICGGYGGIMEAVSKGAREEGGIVTGVCAEALKRNPNPYLSKIIWMKTYPQRLAKLIEISDVCVFFDGGVGTFTELFLVLTLKTRGIGKSKPCIVIGREMEGKVRKVLEIINEEPYGIDFFSSPHEAIEFIEKLR
jgi:uncharacterized protein (TIGR00725 family)